MIDRPVVSHVVPGSYGIVRAVKDYASAIASGLTDVMQSEILSPPMKLISHRPIILHYSGYGYSRKGVPFWLLKTVREWKKESPHTKLLIIFHELWADPIPFGSAFWLHPFQKKIVQELYELSDRVLVTTDETAARLRLLVPWSKTEIDVIPIPSVVGEPKEVSPVLSRSPKAVVFGAPSRRSSIYSVVSSKLVQTLDALGIQEIIDIGEESIAPKAWHHFRVSTLGPLSAEKVSEILSDARVGLIYYPPSLLFKSSVFAAYSVHGLLPVVIPEAIDVRPTGWDAPPAFYINAKKVQVAPDHIDSIVKQARKWYQSHALSYHQEWVKENLFREETLTQNDSPKVAFLMAQPPLAADPFLHFEKDHNVRSIAVYCNGPVRNDEEFLKKPSKNRRLLDEHPWVILPNISPYPGLQWPWSLINPSIRSIVRECDKVVIYGNRYVTMWLAVIYARFFHKSAILFFETTSSEFIDVSIKSNVIQKFYVKARRKWLSYFYTFFFEKIIVRTSRAKEFMVTLGIPETKIYNAPYEIVDEWKKGEEKH